MLPLTALPMPTVPMPTLLLANATTAWTTPLWLVSAGAMVGLVVLAALWGVVWLVSRSAAGNLRAMACEAPTVWVLGAAGVGALFAAGVWAAPLVGGEPLVDTRPHLRAALPWLSGPGVQRYTVPAETGRFDVPLPPMAGLQSLRLAASGEVTVTAPYLDDQAPRFYALNPEHPLEWHRARRSANPLNTGAAGLSVANTSSQPVTLEVVAQGEEAHAEAGTLVTTAVSLVALVLLLAAVRLALPTTAVIATATCRNVMSQRLFWIVLVLGVLLLKPFLFPIPSLMFLPYNTFGEDVKMLKESGLSALLVLGVVLALWSASTSIAEELEGRTALTLLSKPVSRRQFLVGKFLGIVGAVGALYLVLGLLFMVTASYKVIYDAQGIDLNDPLLWRVCHAEMTSVVPGLVLGFFETVVLASVAVAISTRLPMLANLVICAAVYILGHLVPMLVEAAGGQFPIVAFMGQLLATLLPVLDHFKVPGAVLGGSEVPLDYLVWAGTYTLIYSTMAMLLALALFEDRDLA